MATRLYLQNFTPVFTGFTIKGTWAVSTSAVRRLGPAPSGSATTATAANSAAGTWAAHLLTFATDKLASSIQFSTNDTLSFVLGGGISSLTNTGASFDIYAYVSQGDSSTSRGAILTNSVDGDAWSATQTGRGTSTFNLTSGVFASAGDHLVVEVGFQKTGTASQSRTGTLNYGDTGADLTEGSTSVTTLAGWIQCSRDIPLQLVAQNFQFVRASDGNAGILSVTEKIH